MESRYTGFAFEAAWLRIVAWTFAMSNEAGSPLPDTSPRHRASRPPGTGMKSKRSPPTSCAGIMHAAKSKPRIEGISFGMRFICTSRAARSSFCILIRSRSFS